MAWEYEFAYKCCACGSDSEVIHQSNSETKETRDICVKCADNEEAEAYFEEED